jgi:inorganic triphosphatase YgiF
LIFVFSYNFSISKPVFSDCNTGKEKNLSGNNGQVKELAKVFGLSYNEEKTEGFDMEFEVKLVAERKEILEEILKEPQILAAMAEEIRTIPMETTYYDAPDGSLRAKKWALRLRKEGGVPVVTLKTPTDRKGYRNEWECECQEVLAAVPELIRLGAPESLREMEQVVPVCGAAFTRRAVMLALPGCKAELALDLGILFRGDRSTEIQELELELKDGEPAAMLELGDYLCRTYDLREEQKSKFYRASRL